MLNQGVNNQKIFFFKMFFIYVIYLILLASMCCSNNYILDNIQHNHNVDSLRLLDEIYNRQSLVYDNTLFNNTNNFISLKNINNSFNIQCLNDRVYYYSSRFTTEDAWNKAAVFIYNNTDITAYTNLLKTNPTPHTIKTCEVWAYVHLLELQNK